MKRCPPCARFLRVHHNNFAADTAPLRTRLPPPSTCQRPLQSRIRARWVVTQVLLAMGLLGAAIGTPGASSAPAAAAHGTRRAVLVGIDHYRFATDAEIEAARPQLVAAHMLAPGKDPPARDWHALDGAVNDERAMRELLVHRYGFENSHITELPNEAATRGHILAALEQNFVTDARDGDVLFFFYSGHGSQMRNTLSASKGDKVDETIVPWDANAGYFDIRDKELARIFNAALAAHHVTLTAIFDSCHSGSIARGLIHHKAKSEPEDTRDAADAYSERPPEERGALILSAAQFDEEALEAEDATLTPAQPHGAFALSLMQAMQNSDPATPAVELFRSARSRLHTLGSEYTQEPVIAGTAERQHAGLFGDAPRGASFVRAQLVGIDSDRGDLTLDAGFAVGLAAGARFVSTRDPSVSIEVTQVLDLGQSRARVIAGNPAALQLSDEFRMTRWSAPGAAPLALWMPEGTWPLARLPQLAQAFAPLTHGNFHWVIDPSIEAPTQWLHWSGKQWLLASTHGAVDVTGSGALPDFNKISAQLKSEDHLLVLMPPPAEWQGTLQAAGRASEMVSDPAQATYWLTGTLKGTSLAYAWVQPDAAHARANTLTLPARTDWIATMSADGAARLQELAQRLGAVAALLRLPESGDSDPFPYHLVLRRVGDRRELSGTALARSASPSTGDAQTLTTPEVTGGELYDVVLKADAAALADFSQGNTKGRRVYVFSVDSTGERGKLFVYGDQIAQFPRDYPPQLDDPQHLSCKGGPYSETPPLTEVCVNTIVVCPDYGLDTYFLLSTDNPITDTSVFEGQGVRTGESQRNALGPGLAALLDGERTATRSATPMPEQFSVERLTVRSSGAAAPAACQRPPG